MGFFRTRAGFEPAPPCELDEAGLAVLFTGGGLGEERGDDGHGRGDGLRVSERGPQAHDGVWRPRHQEHDDHHDGHLQRCRDFERQKIDF